MERRMHTMTDSVAEVTSSQAISRTIRRRADLPVAPSEDFAAPVQQRYDRRIAHGHKMINVSAHEARLEQKLFWLCFCTLQRGGC